MRIVLAEDEPTIVRVVRLALENTQHIVDAATSSDQAIAAIHAHTPGLVLTNIDLLDRGDGLRLLEFLRPSDIPVVLFTAYGPYSLAQCLRMGAVAYLPKPFNLSELTDVVKRFTPPADVLVQRRARSIRTIGVAPRLT